MRVHLFAILLFVSGFGLLGCAEKSALKFVGPTVDSFSGTVVQDGKPVKFPDGEEVTVQVITEQGARFGIPISSDGTFKVGKMQVGKYSATLERTKPGPKGSTVPSRYNVPGGFKIEEGKSEYTIDLGKGWKA